LVAVNNATAVAHTQQQVTSWFQLTIYWNVLMR
jgi:hypothetical protein